MIKVAENINITLSKATTKETVSINRNKNIHFKINDNLVQYARCLLKITLHAV